MNGYIVPVKNTLIEPKHIAAMRDSVWLYLWLLDKMTSIDSQQLGRVLGGKPITYDLIEADLGISIREYRRWVNTLRDAGYIQTVRTPRGLSMSVVKASKFKQKGSAQTVSSQKQSDVPGNDSDVPESTPRSHGSGTSNIRHNNDNTIDYTHKGDDEPIKDSPLPTIESSPDALTSNRLSPKALKVTRAGLDDVVRAFEKAMETKLRKPTSQRNMAEQLLEHYGEERVFGAIQAVAAVRDERYAPRILDLQDLWEKWARLEDFFRRHRNEQASRVVVIRDEDDEA